MARTRMPITPTRNMPIIAAALLSAFAAALFAVHSAAAAGGGPPVPGQSFGGGVTGPPDAPSSALRYSTLPNRGGTTILATAVDGGEIRRSRSIPGRWSLPAVTLEGEPGGLSADGGTLILLRPNDVLRPDETEYLLLDAQRLRIRERISFDGLVSFDAISPDGRLIYLVDYAKPNDPLDYEVRAYDVTTGKLRPGAIVDPEEPGEQMRGQPVARETSPDGRWAYTLYGGGEETFVHALDTEGATAVCVDLPQFESGNHFRLDLDVDPSSGEIAVLERGEEAARIDPEGFEVSPVSAPSAATPPKRGIAWQLWGVIGLAAIGGIGALALRRRRTGSPEPDLERALRDAGDPPDQVRERDREPIA